MESFDNFYESIKNSNEFNKINDKESLYKLLKEAYNKGVDFGWKSGIIAYGNFR